MSDDLRDRLTVLGSQLMEHIARADVPIDVVVIMRHRDEEKLSFAANVEQGDAEGIIALAHAVVVASAPEYSERLHRIQ